MTIFDLLKKHREDVQEGELYYYYKMSSKDFYLQQFFLIRSDIIKTQYRSNILII